MVIDDVDFSPLLPREVGICVTCVLTLLSVQEDRGIAGMVYEVRLIDTCIVDEISVG